MGSHFSVLVCTSGQKSKIELTLNSILKNDPEEIVLVDQGQNGYVASIVKAIGDDRIRHIVSRTTGLPAARNLGAKACRCNLVAVTDDDCVVEADWLMQITKPLIDDSRIGIVFGNVLASPHDKGLGFIPTYVRRDSIWVRSIHQKHLTEGMGACFAFRKSVWERLGGFDPLLGRGERMCSAGETDFVVRALLTGTHVFETPGATVTHHGFRTWEQRRQLVYIYLYGVGALYTKHLKQGKFKLLPHLMAIAVRYISGAQAVQLGSDPPQGTKLQAFLSGAQAGLMQPVDQYGRFKKTTKPLGSIPG